MVGAGIATAFAASLVWCLASVPLGHSLGFVDRPDGSSLKIHQRVAVPLGGVGILLAVWSGWWLAGGLETRVMAPASALVLLGLVDDRIGLSAPLRLAAQLVISIVAVASGAFPPVRGLLTVVVAVGLIVVSINAVNLFDGLDGLAGSAALVAALGLAALALLRGIDPNLGLILAAGLAGFLIFNRHPARVFLGDNGAYLVGFLLAVEVIRVSPSGLGWQLTVAVLLLGVFIVDLLVTIARRWLAGRPLFVGDRSHLYDRMVGRGWSIGKVAFAAVILQLGFVALALLLEAALLA